MILNSIYLSNGDLGLPIDYRYEFKKGSRFICNYLEREVLSKLRFRVVGFSRLSVSLFVRPEREFFVNSSKVACIALGYIPAEYDRLSLEGKSRFYLGKLEEGIRLAAKHEVIPKVPLLQGLEDFIRNGCVNEWIHLRRTFPSLRVKASLKCRMTVSEFLLILEVQANDGRVIFDDVILKTAPDEFAYKHRFKDIEVRDQNLLVMSRFGEELYAVHLGAL